MRIYLLPALVLLSLFLSLDMNGQHTMVENPSFSDSTITISKLSNGFTTFIKSSNDVPTITLTLIVKVGYCDEDLHETEFSHLLEHFPFDKTIHINNAHRYFQQKGLKLGEDIGGYTTNTFTAFHLTVPNNDNKLLEDALVFLSDCAQGIIIDSFTLNNQKKIIIREASFRNGGINEFIEKQFLLNAAVYSDNYKQKFEVAQKYVAACSISNIQNFYHKWYRPDNQALIVVGNINGDKIKNRITNIFSKLRRPSASLVPKKCDSVHWDFSKLINIRYTGDKNYIRIYAKAPVIKDKLSPELKFNIPFQVVNEMLTKRIGNMMLNNRPGFRLASHFGDSGSGLIDFNALITTIEFDSGAVGDNFKKAIVFLEQIKQNGFSAAEFASAKKNLSDKISYTPIDISDITSGIIRYFADNIDYKDPYDIKKSALAYLDTIGLETINIIANELIEGHSNSVIFMLTDNEYKNAPTETQMMAWINEVKVKKLEQVTEAKVKDLMTEREIERLKIRPVKSEKTYALTNVKKIILANGSEVYLKPISFQQSKEIVIHGFVSHGYNDMHSSKEKILAAGAAGIISQSGVGSMNADEFSRWTTTNQITIYPYIDKWWSGIRAYAREGNIELALQGINRYIYQPASDSSQYSSIFARIKDYSAGNDQNTQKLLADSIRLSTKKSSDNQGLSLALRNGGFSQILDAYKKIIDSSTRFTYVIAGDFDINKIIPSIAKYLGQGNTKEVDVSRSVLVPTDTAIEKNFRIGTESNSMFNIIFKGSADYSQKEKITLDIATGLLYRRLFNRLRKNEPFTYVIYCTNMVDNYPDNLYKINVGFETDASLVKPVLYSLKDEIDKIISKGISTADLDELKKALTEKGGMLGLNPGGWESYISKQLINRQHMDAIASYGKEVRQISIQGMNNALRQFLQERNRSIFYTIPVTHSPN